MMELTIKGQVYEFHFGMGFMREVNKKYQKPIDGVKNATENIGLQMMVAGVISKDTEFLVEVLDAANKGKTPRVTKTMLDSYIDDECEDIDALFNEVLESLKTTNATKNVTLQFMVALEEEKAKAKQ